MCSEVLIITGDFNLHMDDSTDPDAMKFSELLETFSLLQHVTFPSHVSGHWLNLTIACLSNDVMVVSPHPALFLSDHCFAECVLAIPSAAIMVKEVHVYFLKWKDIDLEAFKGYYLLRHV